MSYNGIQVVKENVLININSNTRLNPGTSTSSNFTYTLNDNVDRCENIIIKNVEIPFTFYVINSTNNVLTFNSAALSITITPGNYTTSSLAVELKTRMDTAFADITTVAAFSHITYLLTLTRGTAFNVDAAVDQPTSTAAYMLGFRVSTATATSVTGDSIYNISGPNYICLRSNYLVQAANRKVMYSDNTYENVLMIIPLLVSIGDIISIPEPYVIPVRLSYKFIINKNDIIDFSITDEYGNILDLHGAPVAIQIVIVTD